MLTKMSNLIYYDCAIKGFERSVVAEMVETQEARIKSSSVFYKAKVVSTIFRLDEQFNRVALNSGFFVAVLPTIYSVLVSAAGKNRLKSFKRQQGTCINPAKELRTCE